MAFFLNTEISETKSIVYSLQDIYGIGPTLSFTICKKLGLNPKTSLSKLPKTKLKELFYFIETNFIINEELKKNVIQQQNFFNKIKHIKSVKQKLKKYAK